MAWNPEAQRIVKRGLKELGISTRKASTAEGWCIDAEGVPVAIGPFALPMRLGMGLQVVAPICKVTGHPFFHDHLLQQNADMHGLAMLGQDGEKAWLMRARSLADLDAREVAEMVRWVAHYAPRQRDAAGDAFGPPAWLEPRVARAPIRLEGRHSPDREIVREAIREALQSFGAPDLRRHVSGDAWECTLDEHTVHVEMPHDPLRAMVHARIPLFRAQPCHPDLFAALSRANDAMGGLACFAMRNNDVYLLAARDGEDASAKEIAHMIQWLLLYADGWAGEIDPLRVPQVVEVPNAKPWPGDDQLGKPFA